MEIVACATPENEETLLALAARNTVGRMKDLLKAQHGSPTDDETLCEPDSAPLCTLTDRKSTRLNSSHPSKSRMPSSA